MTQINDCKLSFYLANGATTNDLQDAEREWLLAQGYTGSYSDMSTQFWIDNNCYE